MIFLSVDGRDLLYAKSKTNVNVDTWKDAFYFYAETNPLGVIGSFISDNYKKLPDYYRYKHRFFLYALDCEVMYQILLAMSEQKDVQLKMYDLHSDNLEFTVHPMKFIVQRLMREKRNGTIEKVDEHHYTFSIDVFDAKEIIPWIRSFIGRIVHLECSNPDVTKKFYQDVQSVYEQYNRGDTDDFQ